MYFFYNRTQKAFNHILRTASFEYCQLKYNGKGLFALVGTNKCDAVNETTKPVEDNMKRLES